MKKFLSLLLALCTLIGVCGCGKYTSSYMALGLFKTQTSHSCKASFQSLKGQLVFKLKKTESGTEGDISYSIQVEEGEIRLYYDMYGTKEELISVKAGESVEGRGGYVEGGKTIYILIEATEKAKGKIEVELDHAKE